MPKKYVGTIVIVLLILMMAATLIRWRSNLPYKIEGLFSANPQVLLSLSGVEVIGRADGRKAWSFKAKTAEVTQGQVATTFVSTTDGNIYSDNKAVFTINAGKAVYISGIGDVNASGGVNLRSVDGYKASAESASWSGYMKQLTCQGRVVFSSGDSKLIGEDLVADWKNGEVTLKNGKMTVSVPKMKEAVETQSGVLKGQNHEDH